MKKLQEKRFLFTIFSQYKDVNLGWKNEMDIKKDNLLIDYNLIKAISNNIIVEVIQKESNYSDFKVVLEKYKNI